ncbi:MAG: FecR family protein [Bacteroidia bacterium]
MDKKRIIHLLNSYKEQTATTEEKKEFAQILHDPSCEDLFNEIFEEDWNGLKRDEIDAVEFTNYDLILNEIKLIPQRATKRLWPRITIAAACIVLLFSVGLYFYSSSTKSINEQILTKNDIPPGKNGATLTLSNGKKILIEDALSGNIANEAGVKITKTKDGQLIYEITEANSDAVGYNTLSTSRGEQTQVRLQDGTIVYLNAESSLTYPTSFAKLSQREVKLTGEGYFEVAKLNVVNRSGAVRIPFFVTTATQEIEVLGTHFNVNAYADENFTRTTLIEGSVNVSLASPHKANLKKGLHDVTLKPGQQSITKNFIIETKTVETDDVVAWKNGYFMFNNETLESIMKKVSRWYNVDVVYKDNSIKKKTFFGSVSRFDKASELLKLLQKTEGASFEINGKQIIVNQTR